mmetsp:Transcript_21174/g.31591  ORF Transcript_21174/g.31591 Transcript_21174/m.31591 type:complete len:328 (-) Transcript_21174:1431-2414(-)
MTRTLGIKSLILLLVCGTKKIHSFATPNCSSGTSRKRNISSGFPTCANGQRSESRGTAFLTDANGVEKCSNRLRSASFLKMIDGDMENVTTKSVDEFDLEKVKVQLKAFWEMALPYFEESKNGRWLFAGMIGMTLLNSGVSVTFSYVLRDFWSALSAKDAELFQSIILKFGAALVVAVPVSTYYRFQREKLAVEWREWMTDRTLQLYYSNRVYYSLERGSEIDNPDQRIAEDVRSFTAFSLSLFISVATSVIDLASFSTILYSIQPQLFGVIVGYALFGTVTTTALGRKLVGLNYEKLQKEADFRYSLVRIRENAESIAFYSQHTTI